jgi:hypothetical protein
LYVWRERIIDELHVGRTDEKYLMNYTLGEKIKDN